MIICSVCGLENDDLSIVCSSCKSFLQGRVDALDLFETMWGLMESPRRTMKRIVLAKHKNYTVLLSSFFGICLALDIAWYKNIADKIPSLLTIVGAAILFGPIIGLLVVSIASLVLRKATTAFGGNASQRNLFAAISYAIVPIVFSLVFIVPIEIAIFGIDFFGTNPPPMIIKPTEYLVLIGLKSIATLYGVYLLIEATMGANAFNRKKLLPVALSVISLIAVGAVVLHFAKV